MGGAVEKWSARVLLLQTLAHALIFAAQNAGNFAERALLAPDTAATAALGLGWTAFCLLFAFTTNVVNACQLVVGRCTGAGDESGARAAARQALLLAAGGGALGLALAGAAAAVAACATGPSRATALFLATQGLALGPLLGARALLAYFAGTLRIGPRVLVAVSVLPIAVHLALAWLFTGLLSWSVAGAGVARLGAALVALAAALAVARAEFGSLVGVRWADRALLGTLLSEGSVLGLQQVVAGLMVLLLYLTAARAGDVTSAALTLTHSGVYPLLFCFAWGSSQAVGAAAAQVVGQERGLGRLIGLGLGLAAVLAFALPWGAYAACGTRTLAWLVGDNPAGAALLAASVRFMGLLAVFFVFDFAINFLSALLTAAGEQVYLLRVTAATAAGFVLLLLALPSRPDGACLLRAFITAQAAWAVLLLRRVAGRWPGACCPDRWLRRRFPFPQEHTMEPLQPNTALLPPAQRALALGLLIEAVLPLLNRTREESRVYPGSLERGSDGKAELWQALRCKCAELSTLVLRCDDPGEAASYVLGYLPKHLEYVFEELFGRKRSPMLRFEAAGPVASRNGRREAVPAEAGPRPCPPGPEN
jgi:Na+-driven multidrug efflux pump